MPSDLNGLVRRPDITRVTKIANASTTINFISIPDGIISITIAIADFSTNGTSDVIVRIGSTAAVENASYSGTGSNSAGTVTTNQLYTTGFGLLNAVIAATTVHGRATLELVNPDTNMWAWSSLVGRSDVAATYYAGGSRTLSAPLRTIQFTTVNGTDIFDSGYLTVTYRKS